MKLITPEQFTNLRFDDRKKYISVASKYVEALDTSVAANVSKYRSLHWAVYKHKNTRLQNMNFRDLPYLLSLYKQIDDIPRMVVEKSVQCGLSELFIIQSHIEAGERGMTVMYVLPKYELRNRFVNNRIYKLHKRVAAYEYYTRKAETKVHRTSLMHFGSGTLAYVGSNVSDEFIEIPVDSAYIDEKDRCNQANLLMLPDRLTASPYRFQREISNPTVEEFGIDERYLESTRGVWMLKCPGCGQWFTPDFFQHVVKEVSHNAFVPRDPNANPDPNVSQEIAVVHDCGAVINRLSNGEWVHEYPDREWKGFRVSKVFSKFTTMRELYKKWKKAVGNELKTQIFYNSDLGLPYSSEGSKITRAILNDCCVDYEWPVRMVSSGNPRFMGVDVGDHLHVVLRERLKTRDGEVLRLIGVWAVPGFNQLVQLIREWSPKIVVVDSMPEIHKVMELKEEFGTVWSSRFQEGVDAIVKHKDRREVRMDRTALMDYVHQEFELKNMLLPLKGEFLEQGEYYAHMQAPTRVLEANQDHPEKSRFVWKEGSRPDHFFLAEAYCMQASMIMPDYSIFDFYEREAEAMQGFGNKRRATHSADNLSDEQRKEMAKTMNLTPEMFLDRKRDEMLAEKRDKPKVDDERIRDIITMMNKSQGYVDAPLCAQMASEDVADVERVLLMLRFNKTKISGQYKK